MTPPQQRKDLVTRRWRNVAGATPNKEVQFQIDLVRLVKLCKREDVTMLHIPNGEHRDIRTAAKLKAMGVLPGVSDLLFLWRRYREDSEGSWTEPGVLFMELKTPGKTASELQIAFGLLVRTYGMDFCVVRSLDEALDELKARNLLDPKRQIYGRGLTR